MKKGNLFAKKISLQHCLEINQVNFQLKQEDIDCYGPQFVHGHIVLSLYEVY